MTHASFALLLALMDAITTDTHKQSCLAAQTPEPILKSLPERLSYAPWCARCVGRAIDGTGQVFRKCGEYG